MRSLPLAMLAAATLLSPAVALAGPAPNLAAPAPSAGTEARSFEIRALVLGDVWIDVSGKLGIDGSRLSASAGCNLIGGTVTVDGDTVTIVGPTFMTEMACPGTDGDAEAMLIKVLALSTFKITAGAWVADGGQIVTVEIPTANPGPNATPPDEPISTGVPTLVDPVPGGTPPAGSCPPAPSGGSTGSGGGSTGSVGSTSSGGSGTATAGTGVTVPGATPGATPGAEPGTEPGATGLEVPPPAPLPAGTFELGQVEPDPSFVVEPAPPIGVDPGIGKPVDPCLAYATGSSQVAAGDAVPPKAVDTATEAAGRDAAVSNALFMPLLLVLGAVLFIGIRRFPRGLPTRR